MMLKASDVIDKILTETEYVTHSRQSMVADIQRIGLRIKPIIGDIEWFSTVQRYFLKPLWKMAKVDEIVNKYFDTLDFNEQEALMLFLEGYDSQNQNDFNRAVMRNNSSLLRKEKQILKLEVIKQD